VGHGAQRGDRHHVERHTGEPSQSHRELLAHEPTVRAGDPSVSWKCLRDSVLDVVRFATY
jgi:hypothetical protein